MSNLEHRFEEDRAMRDAARRNFMADVAHTRAGLSGTGIATRIFDRIGEGARDVFETAKIQADDNRGVVAALLGAFVLWFGRGPLIALFERSDDDDDECDDSPDDTERHDPDDEVRRDERHY